jgi:hypothetical protein
VQLKVSKIWTLWYTPVISALWRLRQEVREFKARLDYTVSPCLEKEGRLRS